MNRMPKTTIKTKIRSKKDNFKPVVVATPSVSNAKNMTSSNGLFTGFLNLIIESAPIIPRDKAISSLIIDVIIYPMPGSNKQVAR